jgi:hypothetical protein
MLPAMVAHIIGFVLQNLPALLFVVALLVAAARGRHGPVDCRQLRVRQRRYSVLHGPHLPDAGHCFFINRETTKVLGVTLTFERFALNAAGIVSCVLTIVPMLSPRILSPRVYQRNRAHLFARAPL